MNKKHFVIMAGNIGVGKSSFTTMFAQRYNFRKSYEVVDQNPYLANFYQDMRRWAFHLQIFFLTKRFAHHFEIQKGTESTVQDRSIYEDPMIFAKNLYLQGNMTENDYRCYIELFDNMARSLAQPDLLIYLRADVNTLRSRIAKRGRDFEKGISEEYLKQLASHYEDFATSYPGPMVAIDTDDLDFVNCQDDFDYMCDKVWTAMNQADREAQKIAAEQISLDLPLASPTYLLH